MPNTRPVALLLLSLSMLALCINCSSDDDDENPADDDAADDDSADDDQADDDDDAEPLDWQFITDAQGRALILHGCNFDGSAKWNSGLPPQDREQTLSLFSDWGFNFARYLIFWAKIEPEPGVYDEQYLDEVETRLDWLDQAGITVVLDMHQDVWGPYFHGVGNDGAPDWATLDDGLPHIPFGEMFNSWALSYLSPAVMRTFDNFWDYELHPELQDLYAAMWLHVAERFQDHPAVLGYDLINEPWEGSGIFNQRWFDRTQYQQFNQRLIDALRTVDQERWIFFEPRAFGPNQGQPSHLDVLRDPRDGNKRLAYFPHLYPLPIDINGGYDPQCDVALANWSANRAAESARQRAPVLAGEWSMLRWFDLDNRLLFNDLALRMLEQATSGWAYWDCGFFQENPVELQALIGSPYPRAVAGWPIEYGYDEQTRELSLSFEGRENVEGPTEIYVPATRNYPEGFEIAVGGAESDEWRSEWDEQSAVLSVWIEPTDGEFAISVYPR